MTAVILQEMKTAISLPDELFQQADELARRLGIPRSRLYARALTEYLEAHAPGQITSALNDVYDATTPRSIRASPPPRPPAIDEDQW